ncbi:hypothetical protein [Agrobacterium tumefaciens]|uniref:hypothetical protein n=1 Tax=Agrobacterium tumefaciens TaxID=358 RepID=UPI0015743038|nr:hypothetical protein [Agrobacterium tumefaciens]
MHIQLILAAWLSVNEAMLLTAATFSAHGPVTVQAEQDVFLVGAKRKKKPYIRNHPRKGDVLIGPVDGFNKPDWRTTHRAREGDDLGGLIGQAVNNFLGGRVYSNGGRGRGTGAHQRPVETLGQNCGPQYWTSSPTSPSC